MGKLDGFLNAFKINNDDDDYIDNGGYPASDDVDDEVEATKPQKLFKSSRKNNDSVDDDYEEPKKSVKSSFWQSKPAPKTNTKKGQENMEVSIYYPKTLESATVIVDALLSQKSVIMNLEGIEMEVAMRIFDFITGATYALDGRLESISKYVYVVTPNSVNISGDTNSEEDGIPIGKGFPV